MLPWDLSKFDTYWSLCLRTLGAVAGCWCASVIACLLPRQWAMRDQMHFTALSRNGWLWDQCWRILHFKFKNTLVSRWVSGRLWLVGEDKFILLIVYYLQLPAALPGLGEGKGSSASPFFSSVSCVCSGSGFYLLFILVFHFHCYQWSRRGGSRRPTVESSEFLPEMEHVLPKHP